MRAAVCRCRDLHDLCQPRLLHLQLRSGSCFYTPIIPFPTMAPQDSQTAALLSHVVSQIETNVNFLASQGYISQSDASAILTKLPNGQNHATSPAGIAGLASRVSNMVVGAPRTAPPPAARPQARALWPYQGDVCYLVHSSIV
jgi:hypothetical protein